MNDHVREMGVGNIKYGLLNVLIAAGWNDLVTKYILWLDISRIINHVQIIQWIISECD